MVTTVILPMWLLILVEELNATACNEWAGSGADRLFNLLEVDTHLHIYTPTVCKNCNYLITRVCA